MIRGLGIDPTLQTFKGWVEPNPRFGARGIMQTVHWKPLKRGRQQH